MNYAQVFGRVLILLVLATSINAHLEPRTAPLTTSELQDKGKLRSIEKACKKMKKRKRSNYESICGRRGF
jgi:hypothetical protein